MRFLRVRDSVVHMGGQLHGWLYTCEGQHCDYFIPQLRGEVDDRCVIQSSSGPLSGMERGVPAVPVLLGCTPTTHCIQMMNDAADASIAGRGCI